MLRIGQDPWKVNPRSVWFASWLFLYVLSMVPASEDGQHACYTLAMAAPPLSVRIVVALVLGMGARVWNMPATCCATMQHP